MSTEKPIIPFRPILFDEVEPEFFLKATDVECVIVRPTPIYPAKGISFEELAKHGEKRIGHDTSQKGSQQLYNTKKDVRRQEEAAIQATLEDAIPATEKGANGTMANRGFMLPVSAEDDLLGLEHRENSRTETHRDSGEAAQLKSTKPLNNGFSGSAKAKVHNPDTARKSHENNASDQATLLRSLEQKSNAPLSTSSSLSMTCSVGPPTITSIDTTNSILSYRDSEFVKPMPRRALGSFIKQASPAQQENDETAVECSSTPRKTELNRLSSDEPGSKSSSGSNGTLFGERELSEKKGLRFRKLVSASRQKSGTEPGGINKKKLSSSSSSATDIDETTGAGRRTSSERKSTKGQTRSSGPFAALKLRKVPSGSVDESDSNPWFQERSRGSFGEETSDEEVVPRPRQSSEDAGLKLEKAKKKRLRKIGRHIFGKDKEDKVQAPVERYETSASSSTESLTAASWTTDENRISQEIVEDAIKDTKRLEKDARRALLNRQGLENVLDKILALCGRPPEDLQHLLFKYLGSNSAVESGIQLILNDVPGGSSETSGRTSLTEAEVRNTKRYLLVHTYVTGPSRLRKAIIHHSKARMQLLAFLRQQDVGMNPDSEAHVFKVHCLTKILNGVLTDSPSDVTELLSGNSGFLCEVMKNHIHVPEVADFVCQLCAANALSDSTGDELRYGAPNAAGIVLLSKEGICDLLVRMFEDSCDRKTETSDAVRWQIQVMSTQCLLELSKRSVVVLKFSKNNCSYSSKYIKVLNEALESINSFENVDRVSRLLQAGLGCVQPVAGLCSAQEAAATTNGAVCALSFVTELLDLVSAASNSKSVVTRRTVGTSNTKGLEILILAKTADMCKLLEDEKYTGAHGRLKMEIVKTFRSLFDSKLEESRMALVDSGVPECLLRAVRKNKLGSIIHGYVVGCIAASLKRDSSGRLHRAWLSAIEKVGMMEEMMKILDVKCEGKAREGPWSTYRSTVVDIGFVLCMFSQNLTRGEFRGLFASEEVYQMFIGKIEPGLGKIEESRRGACGGPKPEGTVVSVLANADALAAKIDDVDAV